MRNPTLGRHARNAQRALRPEFDKGLLGSYAPILGDQGVSILNSSGSGAPNASLVGTPAYAISTIGHVYRGHGGSDGASLGSPSIFQLTGQKLTIACRFSTKTVSSVGRIFQMGDMGSSPYTRYNLSVRNTGHIRFEVSTTGNPVKVELLISANTIYSMTATYDGSFLRLYIDGLLAGSTPQTGNISNAGSTASIGFSPQWAGNLDGDIGYVHIYDDVKDLEFARALYRDQFAPYRLRPTHFGMAAGGGPTLKTIAENAANIENLQIAVSLAISELASAVEAPQINSNLQIPESGAALDNLSITGTGQINISDAGSASETIDLIASLNLPDTGSGLDTIDIAARVAIIEPGSGSDTAKLSVTLPITEIASGLDTLSLLASIAQTDSASATDSITADTGATLINITDITTGIETLTITANLATTETGSALESLLVNTGIVAQIIRMAAIALSMPHMANIALSVPHMANVVLTV